MDNQLEEWNELLLNLTSNEVKWICSNDNKLTKRLRELDDYVMKSLYENGEIPAGSVKLLKDLISAVKNSAEKNGETQVDD